MRAISSVRSVVREVVPNSSPTTGMLPSRGTWFLEVPLVSEMMPPMAMVWPFLMVT